jgi:hypothetical protein
VNDDAGDLPAPHRITAMRNSDVDDVMTPVKETVQLCGALMAEDGAWTRAEQRRPEFGLTRRSATEGGVDASLHPLPSAVTQLVPDAVERHARSAGLSDV